MQLSRETQIRIVLMLVGGMLATVVLAMWEIVEVEAPSFPGYPYLLIRNLTISFLSGMFSVWLFFRGLGICVGHRNTELNQSKIWVKKGMAAGVLACALTGFVIQTTHMISGFAAGIIQLGGETALGHFSALLFESFFVALLALLVLGLPASIIGAAYGYIAERLTGRLLQLH
jgi:hypothetical protein